MDPGPAEQVIHHLAESVKCLATAALRSACPGHQRNVFVPPRSKMQPPNDNEDAEWLSPEGHEILAVMTDDWQPAKKIAHALGWIGSLKEKAPEKLYILLAEYVGRKLIEKSPDGEGYRLWPRKATTSSAT